VHVYGLPECKKCIAAKDKLDRNQIKYEERSYKDYMTYHDGWKNDGSIDVLTARSFYGENAVPLIERDGKLYDYPGFMKQLRIEIEKSCTEKTCTVAASA
jgi:glutaredoxin